MKAASITELSSFPVDGRMPAAKPAGGEKDAGSFARAISEAVSAGAAGSAGSRMAGKDAGVKMSVQGSDAESSRSEGRSASSVNEKSDAVKKTDDVKAKDPDRKETAEKVEETLKKISGEIEETFDISDEELTEAMEVLGMTMADLIDPSALTQLYAQLSGAEDTMSILTDEGMYAGLQDLLSDVQTLTEGLMEELGVDKEALQSLVGDFVMPEEVIQDSESLELEASEDEPEDDAALISPGGKSTEKAEGTAPSESAKDAAMQEVSQPRRSRESHEGKEQDSDAALMGNAGNQFAAEPADVPSAQEVTFENTTYTAQQTREIARQLVEQIRVNVTQETTSLDMVLNPASLGHVALNIEARNGVITAVFTAQNEAVRAVIENQMIVLRENLESQGIRIEAVEVTVSAQAFDENLERGREEGRQREESQTVVRAAGRRHRINLLSGEEGEEEEELSEEDEINRDMMIRSGNSMDVTA